jgi:hypothetical protein
LERPHHELNPRVLGKLFDEIQPDLVLVGISTNPDGVEKLALKAAKERHIATLAMIETWPHLWLTNYGTRDLELYLAVTRLLVFDEISKMHLLEKGFKENQVIVTGNPENDELPVLVAKRAEIEKSFKNKLGIDNEDKIFTYAITNNLESGQLDIDENDCRWLGFKESTVVIEFLQAVEAARSYQPLRGIIRIKKGRERAPFEALIREYSPSTIIVGEEVKDSRHIILSSDVIVGTTTIMLQTAAFMGVFPISYMPNLSRPDPQFANRLGIIKVIAREGELRQFLPEIARDRKIIDVEKSILTSVSIPTDSTRRVAAAIEGTK